MASLDLTKCIVFSSLLCALCVISGPALADTYHWVDNNGVDSYSEQKPRNIPDDRITTIASGRSREESSPAPSSQANNLATNSGSANQQNLSADQQEMMNKLQEAESGRQAQLTEIKQSNCEKSQRVLANLSAKDRIRVRDANGVERVLPEEERQQRISEAQAGIVANCGA